MRIHESIIYVGIFFLFSNGCQSSQTEAKIVQKSRPLINEVLPKNVDNFKTKNWSVEDFYKFDARLSKKVDSLYYSMDINERAAQLIMPGTGQYKDFGLPFSKIMELYKSKTIGGVLFLKGTRSVFKEEVRKLNLVSKNKKLVPPIFSCDCEPTLFHKKFTDADSMKATSELKTSDEAGHSAASISLEMHRMGIQWNFAPVVDIGINQEIINTRSFGNDPKQIVVKSMAFIHSSAVNNIVATIKHFPGHGAVKGDSHKQLVFIDSALTEIDNFWSIIRLGNPISVMMGHIAVNVEGSYNTHGIPASLSKVIIQDLLRNKIGFKGIIVTDAMNMGAVKKIPGADYLAILAGNDIVVMPQNPQLLHNKIVRGLSSNLGVRKKLEISIKKLLRLKICLGLV